VTTVKNKASLSFPDPRWAETVDGIIAFGGELTAENLKAAYRLGIFPWPHEGYPLLWFCPEQRGVIDFKDLHEPESFKKWRRKNSHLQVTWDQAFDQVIRECQKQKRKNQNGTWITSEIVQAYTDLHHQGEAHSLEVWENESLVGGIYGVQVNGYFSGESMFHKKTNTSKFALWSLIQRLRAEKFEWLDIQMVTSVSAQFGGKLIAKKEFLKRLTI